MMMKIELKPAGKSMHYAPGRFVFAPLSSLKQQLQRQLHIAREILLLGRDRP
jgi:hypothetical protein